MSLTIYLGADHGGFADKEAVKQALQAGHPDWQIEDCGAYELNPGDDYPQFSFAVAEKVANTPDSLGVVFCRSAGGVTIAANKVKGVRAVAATTVELAQHAKSHDNAQVLGIGGDVVNQEEAVKIVEAFVTTPFSGDERHVRRVEQIRAYEESV